MREEKARDGIPGLLAVLLCAEMRCEVMTGNAQEILLINDITWAATFNKNLLLLHIVLSTYEYSLSLSRLNSSFHQLKVAQLSTYRPSRALICFHWQGQTSPHLTSSLSSPTQQNSPDEAEMRSKIRLKTP